MEHAGDLDTLSELLGLKEFEVVDFARDRKSQLVRFTLVPKVGEGLCPHCRTMCGKRHSTGDHVVLDLPLLGCRTELTVRAPPYQWETGHRFFTPRYAAIAQWRAFGMRSFDHLRLRVLHAFGSHHKNQPVWRRTKNT